MLNIHKRVYIYYIRVCVLTYGKLGTDLLSQNINNTRIFKSTRYMTSTLLITISNNY